MKVIDDIRSAIEGAESQVKLEADIAISHIETFIHSVVFAVAVGSLAFGLIVGAVAMKLVG